VILLTKKWEGGTAAPPPRADTPSPLPSHPQCSDVVSRMIPFQAAKGLSVSSSVAITLKITENDLGLIVRTAA
jgi:hypothetical protein